jgi:hypothetical protein
VDANSVEALEAKLAALRPLLGAVADMRPGSLVERYRACGKSGCRCAKEGAPGHGPSWSLTREVAGKTVTRVIPPSAVEMVRAHIQEHKRFRAIVRELVETSERLCDARLMQTDAASQEAAKKGASKKPSRPRSTRRSTTS